MEERSSTLLVPLEFIGKVWEDTRKESEIAASADQTTRCDHPIIIGDGIGRVMEMGPEWTGLRQC